MLPPLSLSFSLSLSPSLSLSLSLTCSRMTCQIWPVRQMSGIFRFLRWKKAPCSHHPNRPGPMSTFRGGGVVGGLARKSGSGNGFSESERNPWTLKKVGCNSRPMRRGPVGVGKNGWGCKGGWRSQLGVRMAEGRVFLIIMTWDLEQKSDRDKYKWVIKSKLKFPISSRRGTVPIFTKNDSYSS